MVGVLLNCILRATMLLGGNMEVKTVQQHLTTSNQAYVMIDGDYYNIDNLNELNLVLNNMLQESHSLPAFGVSIHTETLNAIQKGVWLKLQYNGTQAVDGMPFDELLIEINPDYNGFNIIRGNRGIYDGRCFYVDLMSQSMEPLYQYVVKTFGK